MKAIVKITTAFMAFGLLSSAALATETVTYSYDARGRLVKVVHTGTVNSNNQACYKYDRADNRSTVTVTLGPGTPPACPS